VGKMDKAWEDLASKRKGKQKTLTSKKVALSKRDEEPIDSRGAKRGGGASEELNTSKTRERRLERKMVGNS